jgi:hypothetical protein
MMLERLAGKSAHLGKILLISAAQEAQRIGALDRDQSIRRRQKPAEDASGA